MKYRYTITHTGVVEADTPAEAEAYAWEETEYGDSPITVCEVEPLTRETERE